MLHVLAGILGLIYITLLKCLAYTLLIYRSLSGIGNNRLIFKAITVASIQFLPVYINLF